MADDTDGPEFKSCAEEQFEGLLALLRELAGVRRDLDFVLRQQGQLELERRRLAAKNAECRSKVLEAMAVDHHMLEFLTYVAAELPVVHRLPLPWPSARGSA
jgi:hypothetical protein